MRLVTYNIRHSLGQDGRYDLARVVRAVEGADVIALQEVERFWPRRGMADQPAEIGVPSRTAAPGPGSVISTVWTGPAVNRGRPCRRPACSWATSMPSRTERNTAVSRTRGQNRPVRTPRIVFAIKLDVSYLPTSGNNN